jgi:hypothetical protein
VCVFHTTVASIGICKSQERLQVAYVLWPWPLLNGLNLTLLHLDSLRIHYMTQEVHSSLIEMTLRKLSVQDVVLEFLEHHFHVL